MDESVSVSSERKKFDNIKSIAFNMKSHGVDKSSDYYQDLYDKALQIENLIYGITLKKPVPSKPAGTIEPEPGPIVISDATPQPFGAVPRSSRKSVNVARRLLALNRQLSEAKKQGMDVSNIISQIISQNKELDAVRRQFIEVKSTPTPLPKDESIAQVRDLNKHLLEAKEGKLSKDDVLDTLSKLRQQKNNLDRIREEVVIHHVYEPAQVKPPLKPESGIPYTAEARGVETKGESVTEKAIRKTVGGVTPAAPPETAIQALSAGEIKDKHPENLALSATGAKEYINVNIKDLHIKYPQPKTPSGATRGKVKGQSSDIFGREQLALPAKNKVSKKEFEAIDREKIKSLLSKEEDMTKLNVSYDIVKGFSSINVKWNEKESKLIYSIIEPELDEKEKDFLETIEVGLNQLISTKFSLVKNREKAKALLEREMNYLLDEYNIEIPEDMKNRIFYYIVRDFLGYGVIDAMMNDPYIEDVECDGVGVHIYIVHRKFGGVQTNLILENAADLKNFVVKLAQRAGRYVSYAEPILDGTLPDGSRIHATLAEDVTTKGPTFSIRRFTKEPPTPIDLMELNTVTSEMLAYLWILIENRACIMIIGGTGAGKTTLLNALSLFIPQEDRVISIEDTRELMLPHENWVPEVSRTGFGPPVASGHKYGEVSLFDLLKGSFRQNPDYVIVGEIRGEEAYILFQGMASGHACFGTMHASSVENMARRLTTPPINLSPTLLESLTVSITMVKAKEIKKNARRVKTVDEILTYNKETENIETNVVYEWPPKEDKLRYGRGSLVLGNLVGTAKYSADELRRELLIRSRLLEWAKENNIRGFKEFSKLVEKFYASPVELLKKTGVYDEKIKSKKVETGKSPKKAKENR